MEENYSGVSVATIAKLEIIRNRIKSISDVIVYIRSAYYPLEIERMQNHHNHCLTYNIPGFKDNNNKIGNFIRRSSQR